MKTKLKDIFLYMENTNILANPVKAVQFARMGGRNITAKLVLVRVFAPTVRGWHSW